jgi:hypothetical protein
MVNDSYLIKYINGTLAVRYLHNIFLQLEVMK